MTLPQLPTEPELEAFIRSCVEDFASMKTRSMDGGRSLAFKMTFGCCVQTARFAEAYLVLMKSGLSLEGRALARAALEHAATAQFAYLKPDGFDRLANQASAAEWSLNERMYRWLGIEDFNPGEKEEAGPRLPKVSGKGGIMALLDPGNDLLEPGYAVLSQGVHVTYETVTGFFRTSKEGDLQLYQHRKDSLAHYSLLLVAASCMLVAWIQAEVLENELRLKELEFRSEQLSLPTKLDDGWAQKLWGKYGVFKGEEAGPGR